MSFFSDPSCAGGVGLGLRRLPALPPWRGFSLHPTLALSYGSQPGTGLSSAVRVMADTGCICADSFTP